MGAQSEFAAAATDQPRHAPHARGLDARPVGGTPDQESHTPVIEFRDVHRGRSRLGDRSALTNAPFWKLMVKRSVDFVLAASLLTVFAPIMLLAAMAIRLTSRGPVLFRQERLGRHGKPFMMLKFRSMEVDAHDRLAEVYSLNEHEGPIFKSKVDPRITPVGRALRRTSIDELPQLFHVLSGKMSLVGPRPALPTEVDYYTPYVRQRLLAKPGLTCVWQVSGRSTLDFDTWVEMDLDYIEQWSLRLDMHLLVSTIPAVLSGRGAY